MTLWRTVADHKARIYYFESAVFHSLCSIDMSKVDLKEGAEPKVVAIERGKALAGEISGTLKPATPFRWLGAKQENENAFPMSFVIATLRKTSPL